MSSPAIFQVSSAGKHFCIKTSQRKSCYVENVCLAHGLDVNNLLVVCWKTGISIVDYFYMELEFVLTVKIGLEIFFSLICQMFYHDK